VRAPTGTAALLNGSTTVRRSRFHGENGLLVAPGGSAAVTDSLATATGNDGWAAAAATGGRLQLRNVTAHGSGAGSRGLLAVETISGFPGGRIEAVNVIARGGQRDLLARQGASIEAGHSNYRTSSGVVENLGSNPGGDPLFADLPGGDFRPLAGSPAIDAGTADSLNGATDLAGNPRTQGAAPDIGAYEAAPEPPAPAPAPQTTPDPGSAQPPTPPAARDLSVPVLGGLKASRTRRGTAYRYTLSEPASVTLTIDQAVRGSRKGRRCVRRTARNRRAPRCWRYLKAGTLTRSGVAGLNVVDGKRLKPGNYRATFSARDAAGNAAKPRKLNFRVRRPR
jgi:hypothetical protein